MPPTRTALLLVVLIGAGCSPQADHSESNEATASNLAPETKAESSTGASETAPAPAPARPAREMSESFHNLFQTDSVYFAGMPSEAGLKQMQEAGVTLVINILTEPEATGRVPFDEPALVKSLGMEYMHIPVSPQSFSRQDVDRFAKAMEEAQGKVLVHCASSNRVGGLWASYLMLHKGLTPEEALEQGKAAGLKAPSMVEAFERVVGS